MPSVAVKRKPTRQCTRCRQEKPESQYYHHRNGSIATRCRRCTVELAEEREIWRASFTGYGAPRNHCEYGYGSVNIEEMRSEKPYREMMALCEDFEQRTMALKRGLPPWRKK